MEDIKTWADFGALPKEEMDALSPEEVETLKSTITDHEATLAKESTEKLDKATELADNYKIRAEKAESKKSKKEPEEKKEVTETPNYSIQDIKALSDVHDDDIERLVDYAKFKDITIAEAKKDTVMQAILKEKIEERTTAEIADTKGGRPNSNMTGETLIEKAREGQFSEKESDIDKLVDARMEAKIKG